MPQRNLCPNSSAGNNVTGLAAQSSTGPMAAPTRITGLAAPWDRTTSARVTAPASTTWTELRWAAYNPGSDLAGKVFTGTIQWSVSIAPTGAFYVFLVFLDAGGTLIDFTFTNPTATAGAVNRTAVVGTAPAGTRQVGMWVRSERSTSGWTLTATACRVDEVNDPVLPFGDGDTAGWSWDGTAGNSASTGPPDSSHWPWLLDLINEPPPPVPLRHNLAGLPDGPLTVADTGQPYTLVASGPGAVNPVIRNGAIGTPAGWTPPGSGVAAGYAFLPLGAPCTWAGAMLRWDSSASTGASCCIGAFNVAGYQEGSTNAPIHLSITPTFFQFSVFTGGTGDYTTLVPVGGGSGTVTLATPMPRDGSTETRCDVWIDRAVGRAWVTIGAHPVWVFNDSRITQAAAWPFWEYYVPAGETNLPRFTKVWAGTV